MLRPVSREVLQRFWQDKQTLNEVREYFFAHLDAFGLDRIYERGETLGVADAKQVLENAFTELDDLFEPSDKTNKEPINGAR